MALSGKVTVALALLATTASAACSRKITVQNLCGRVPEADAGAAGQQPAPVRRLRVHAPPRHPRRVPRLLLDGPGAPTAEFHVGPDGGAWYKAPVAQSSPVRFTVTPHTDRAHGSLHGHCPAVGCADHGRCFQHDVPGGNCANVDELKIIYYSP